MAPLLYTWYNIIILWNNNKGLDDSVKVCYLRVTNLTGTYLNKSQHHAYRCVLQMLLDMLKHYLYFFF